MRASPRKHDRSHAPRGDLPVIARPVSIGRDCGTRRISKRGRWRAAVLILIHVAVALHVLHWKLTGRTLTPVEPSEAIQTLGQGLVNAGFVLFVVLILGTLLFGRFFCGWGCHIVALQDLCGWLLRKMQIRPRPFRSRLLVYAPLLAAFYMFVAPTLVRLWIGRPGSAWQAHFSTDDFWGRFPGWFIASLTFLVCGFLIVYLLGNKGFCTYGCPYGGIFGLADQVAPGKIRVTDDCEQCGHCTATCTSNVRVHEEVREHGMVIDPGCMKCMDCVNVCPKGALYFGFGSPTVARGKPRAERRQKRRYDYTWGEEIALAAVFLVAIVITRALYEAVPFLLALGLSAISAWLLVTAGQMFYRRDLRAGQLRLRAGGTTTRTGKVYLGVAALWTVFLLHSGYVKNLAFDGSRRMTAARRQIELAGGASPAAAAEMRKSIGLLERADRLGLAPVPNLLARLGSAYGALGNLEQAEHYYRRAVQRAPGFAESHMELARLALERDDRELAIADLQAAVRARPELPGAHDTLATLLIEAERPREAVEMLERLLLRRPDETSFRLTYGVVLAQAGDAERGLAVTHEVLAARPDDDTAHYNLGQILAREKRFEEALVSCHRAVELNPGSAARHLFCAKIAGRLSRMHAARAYLDRARRLEPFDKIYVQAWVVAVLETDRLDEEILVAERAPAADRATRYSLIFLYAAAGRTEDAERVAAEF